jgi:hypothetical protein
MSRVQGHQVQLDPGLQLRCTSARPLTAPVKPDVFNARREPDTPALRSLVLRGLYLLQKRARRRLNSACEAAHLLWRRLFASCHGATRVLLRWAPASCFNAGGLSASQHLPLRPAAAVKPAQVSCPLRAPASLVFSTSGFVRAPVTGLRNISAPLVAVFALTTVGIYAAVNSCRCSSVCTFSRHCFLNVL